MYRQILGIILAGGQGRRFDYQNKGLIILNQQPLISHLINRLQPQVSSLIISANKDLTCYQKFNLAVYPDLANWQNLGPLGGICSSIRQLTLKPELVCVVPCDTPFLPHNLVDRLVAPLITNSELQITVAKTQTKTHFSVFVSRFEPLLDLADYLTTANHLSIRNWQANYQFSSVEFEHELAFTNINNQLTLEAVANRCIK